MAAEKSLLVTAVLKNFPNHQMLLRQLIYSKTYITDADIQLSVCTKHMLLMQIYGLFIITFISKG